MHTYRKFSTNSLVLVWGFIPIRDHQLKVKPKNWCQHAKSRKANYYWWTRAVTPIGDLTNLSDILKTSKQAKFS